MRSRLPDSGTFCADRTLALTHIMDHKNEDAGPAGPEMYTSTEDQVYAGPAGPAEATTVAEICAQARLGGLSVGSEIDEAGRETHFVKLPLPDNLPDAKTIFDRFAHGIYRESAEITARSLGFEISDLAPLAPDGAVYIDTEEGRVRLLDWRAAKNRPKHFDPPLRFKTPELQTRAQNVQFYNQCMDQGLPMAIGFTEGPVIVSKKHGLVPFYFGSDFVDDVAALVYTELAKAVFKITPSGPGRVYRVRDGQRTLCLGIPHAETTLVWEPPVGTEHETPFTPIDDLRKSFGDLVAEMAIALKAAAEESSEPCLQEPSD